jgi:4-alpha-glucanotransferase
MNIKSTKHIAWDLIRLAMASVADTAIIPMQDYLELGKEGRINIPSTLGDNWNWRMQAGVYTGELAERIREMTELYGRKNK